MLKSVLFVLLFASLVNVNAQILEIRPIFPHDYDTVSIIYHADEGNSALMGLSPVYAHTGVVTNLSATPSSWKYVQGNWGTADPKVLMQDLGNNRHKITYPVRNFYGVPGGEEILKMAFVFRNADGSIVGREADGSDIYTDIYPNGLFAKIVIPSSYSNFAQLGDTFQIYAASSMLSSMTLYHNSSILTQTNGDSLSYLFIVSQPGKNWIWLESISATDTARDSFYYIVNTPVQNINPPAGTQTGINYLNDSTVILRLYAPDKQYAYVLGDFNLWLPDTSYYMKRSVDSTTWWIQINGLQPQTEYGYQYFVDGILKIADPLAEKLLDPWNDQYIDSTSYPGLKSYPDGLTTNIVSILQTGQSAYAWHDSAYQKPASTDLVIYELLIRDFIANHDFSTLIDTLSYLDDLGINAIELMPVNEFEGNESWGYNPSFYLAPDKYYGPAKTMKAFVDSAHARGIAVIMDIALNHSCGQSPMVQLYWDAVNSRPAANSPWFNPIATHPYNVCYDFNHESQATRDFVDRVTTHWVSNYHIDGYRFDLSKGFTQTNSGNDVNAWGQYDASRITNLERIADVIWSTDSTAYVILEHFSVNGEETVLANYGMMLWGKMTNDYNEATMGYPSNLWGASYKSRGWQNPQLVTYMESHDEERLMYKNLQYGNSSGNYNITSLPTALNRMGLAAAFFFTIPGPKMMWQFGEQGYDVSIDNPCRVCNKPIKWFYLNDHDRLKLYKTWRALIHLKTDYPTFRSHDFTLLTSGFAKRIQINDPLMNVTIIGNFDVDQNSIDPNFQHTGWWYDYLSGDSLMVSNVNQNINLIAGKYFVFTDIRLAKPDLTVPLGIPEPDQAVMSARVYPQPASDNVFFEIDNPEHLAVELSIYDLSGKLIRHISRSEQDVFSSTFNWDGRSQSGSSQEAGYYFYRISKSNQLISGHFLWLK